MGFSVSLSGVQMAAGQRYQVAHGLAASPKTAAAFTTHSLSGPPKSLETPKRASIDHLLNETPRGPTRAHGDSRGSRSCGPADGSQQSRNQPTSERLRPGGSRCRRRLRQRFQRCRPQAATARRPTLTQRTQARAGHQVQGGALAQSKVFCLPPTRTSPYYSTSPLLSPTSTAPCALLRRCRCHALTCATHPSQRPQSHLLCRRGRVPLLAGDLAAAGAVRGLVCATRCRASPQWLALSPLMPS